MAKKKDTNVQEKKRTPKDLIKDAFAHNVKMMEAGITLSQLDLVSETKILNHTMYGIQKYRISIGQIIDDRRRRNIPISKKLIEIYEEFNSLEKHLESQIKDVLDDTDIWKYYLKNVGGISYKLASSLISAGNPANFDTVSKFLAYMGETGNHVVGVCTNGHKLIASSEASFKNGCPVFKSFEPVNDEDDEENIKEEVKEKSKCGCTVTITEVNKGIAPRKRAEHHFLFNTRAKTTVWKISEQFTHWRQGQKCYHDIYDNEKARLKIIKTGWTNQLNEFIENPKHFLSPEDKNSDITKKIKLIKSETDSKNKKNIELSQTMMDLISNIRRINTRGQLMAKRKVIKVFVFNYWYASRTLQGLPTRPPYSHEYLGHSKMIDDGCFNANKDPNFVPPKKNGNDSL